MNEFRDQTTLLESVALVVEHQQKTLASLGK